MQSIAIENNLSETAFVLLHENQNPLLRWFTPMCEIDLCGHATLASAHIYLTELFPQKSEVTFDTKFVGPLKVTRKAHGRYIMDFPSRPGKKLGLAQVPSFVLNALTKARPIDAYQARDLMLVYEDETVIRQMEPDFTALMKFEPFIIVTAASTEKYDFISRFFCADDGILEDPVTGSAHSTLTPYWAQKIGRNRLLAYQASRRGGEIELELMNERVYMTGSAIIVIDGKMQLLDK